MWRTSPCLTRATVQCSIAKSIQKPQRQQKQKAKAGPKQDKARYLAWPRPKPKRMKDERGSTQPHNLLTLAAAAPPSRLMNWRRLRSNMGSPPGTRYASLPQGQDAPEAPAGPWGRPESF